MVGGSWMLRRAVQFVEPLYHGVVGEGSIERLDGLRLVNLQLAVATTVPVAHADSPHLRVGKDDVGLHQRL